MSSFLSQAVIKMWGTGERLFSPELAQARKQARGGQFSY